ncbi:MAG: molybdopterin-guanine dinucleotide biosynthesis protein B [Alphaproteobacteria bacterium]|nr:molybdopterin-guanine dinucleotide biosynthesis protein B [Alphaproteobacteria bacterium]
MKVFGLTGYSGSGKTNLMVRLLPVLVARGLRVSTVKHAHHAFDVDTPGKDSYAHRAAGAIEVMVSSSQRWALMHENHGNPEPNLSELLAHLSPVDLVLIEGFKREAHQKVEIVRGPEAAPQWFRDDPQVVAIAADRPIVGVALPVLPLNDTEAVADFIMSHCGFIGTRRRQAEARA